MSAKQTLRTLLPMTGIATAIMVAGVWQFTLPRMVRLREVQAERAATQTRLDLGVSIDEIVPQSVPTDEIRECIRAVESVSRQAADPNVLYNELVALGSQADLEINRITPIPKDRGADDFVVTTFDIVGEGRLDGVLGFLDSLNNLTSFHRVTSFSLVPAGDESNPRVGMRMQVEFGEIGVDERLTARVSSSGG